MGKWGHIDAESVRLGFNPAERRNLERAEAKQREMEIDALEASGELTPEAADAARTAAKANASACLAETVAGAAAELTAEVRMLVASGGRAELAADESAVPSGLMAACTAVLRYNLLARYALDISEPRKKAYEDARALLDKAAEGRLNLDTDKDTTPHPYYNARRSKAQTLRRSRGIM